VTRPTPTATLELIVRAEERGVSAAWSTVGGNDGRLDGRHDDRYDHHDDRDDGHHGRHDVSRQGHHGEPHAHDYGDRHGRAGPTPVAIMPYAAGSNAPIAMPQDGARIPIRRGARGAARPPPMPVALA
jgi:hypothetical protein